MLIVLNYVTFDHFHTVYYRSDEVFAYFILCVWLVPFLLFISLSANDSVLPASTGIAAVDRHIGMHHISTASLPCD